MVNKELQEGFSRRLLVYGCGTWLAIFAVPICAKLLVTDLPFTELAKQLGSDLWFPMHDILWLQCLRQMKNSQLKKIHVIHQELEKVALYYILKTLYYHRYIVRPT